MNTSIFKVPIMAWLFALLASISISMAFANFAFASDTLTLNKERVKIDFEIGPFKATPEGDRTRRSESSKFKVASTTTGTDERIEGGISDVILYEQDDSKDFYDVIFRSFDVGPWSKKLNAETSVLDEVFLNVRKARLLPKTQISELAIRLSWNPAFEKAVAQYQKKADGGEFFDIDAYDRYVVKLINALKREVNQYSVDELEISSSMLRRGARDGNKNYFLIDPAIDVGFWNNFVQTQSLEVAYRDHSISGSGLPDGEPRYYFFNDSSLVYGIIEKKKYENKEGLFFGTNVIDANVGFSSGPSALLDATCNLIDTATGSPSPFSQKSKKTVMTEQELNETLFQTHQNGTNYAFEGVLYTSFSEWSTPTFLNYMNLILAAVDVTGGAGQVINNVLKKKQNRAFIEDTYVALNKVHDGYKQNIRLVKALVGFTTLAEVTRRLAEVPVAGMSAFEYDNIVEYNQTVDNTFHVIETVLSDVRNIVTWVDQRDLWSADDFKFNEQGIRTSSNPLDWFIAWGPDAEEAEAWLLQQMGLKGTDLNLPGGVKINPLNRIPVAMKKFRQMIQDLGARKVGMSMESTIEALIYIVRKLFEIAADDQCLLNSYGGDVKVGGTAIKDHLAKFKGLPLIKLITGVNSGLGVGISYATMPTKVGFTIEYKNGMDNPPDFSVSFDKTVDYEYKKFTSIHQERVLFEKGNISLVEQGYQYTPKMTVGIFTSEKEEFFDNQYLPQFSEDDEIIGLKWNVLRSGEPFNENENEVKFSKRYLKFHKYDLYDGGWWDAYEGDEPDGKSALRILLNKYNLRDDKTGKPVIFINDDGELEATSALDDSRYETFEFTDVMKLLHGTYGVLGASLESIENGTAVSMLTPGSYVNKLSIEFYTKDQKIGNSIEITENMYVLQRFSPETVESVQTSSQLIDYNANLPYVVLKVENADGLIKYYRKVGEVLDNDTGLYLYVVKKVSSTEYGELLDIVALSIDSTKQTVQGHIKREFLDTTVNPYKVRDDVGLILAEGTLQQFLENMLAEKDTNTEVLLIDIINQVSNYGPDEKKSIIAIDTSSLVVDEQFEEEPQIIPENTGGIESACSSTLVPEANSGFAEPLSYDFSNNGGYQFKQEAQYTGGLVYHPGEDWNVPNSPGGGCDDDKGLDIVAVADGLVVYSNSDSWGGLVIQHNYKGETWYSQYGHVQNILVQKDEVVTKGQKIAEIGDVGAGCAHLHFEIRTASHPAPCNGPYWTYGENGLYNLSNVENWYEAPNEFIPAHPAYETKPSITVQTINKENGDIQISGTDLGSSGTVIVDEVAVPGQWTSEGITLNVGALENLDEPMQIKLVNNNGDEFKICYPFVDVCPDVWYARPVITLWKKGIISGYGGDWEGYFRPYEPPASRAEFVTATVRALDANVQPMSVANPSFSDIPGSEWYAPYVEYAKEIGLINGCEADKFCPNKAISRPAGVKVVVEAFLKDTLTKFDKFGQEPKSLFLDVTDQSQWYYPYVYAAYEKDVIHGYSDGYFKPERDMTRAEMAKVICLALATTDKSVAPSDCGKMGKPTDSPSIFEVTPELATLNEPTVFTVVGQNLSDAITFELTDCLNITPIAGGTAEELLFQCTPSNTSGEKNGTLQYNEGHTVFSVNVMEQVVPEVTSVSPTTATLNQLTTFTVVGSNLPDTLAFWIANCDGVTAISRTPEQQQFQCTPINDATGNQEGVVKDASGENKLKVFFVDVVAPVSEPVEPPPTTEPPITEPPVTEEPPVTQEPPPDTSCTPSVDSVEPLTVTVSEPVTFTVSGDCLPETTAFWNDECEGLTALGGSETQRQFYCTPSWKVGPKEGVVKDEPDGNLLKSFTVSVEWGTPKVTSVSPSSASLDQLTEFAVKGQSLTGETALWIGECEGMNAIDRNTEKQVFQCTPSSTPGIKQVVVKDRPGGTELYNESLEVK